VAVHLDEIECASFVLYDEVVQEVELRRSVHQLDDLGLAVLDLFHLVFEGVTIIVSFRARVLLDSIVHLKGSQTSGECECVFHIIATLFSSKA
jgi:hypothetical protein